MENELDYYKLQDGRLVLDKRISERLFAIEKLHPEGRQAETSNYSWDDVGLADVFATIYSNEARYCPEFKSWMVYNGCKWVHDVEGLALADKVNEFIKCLTYYCPTISDSDVRTNYTKFINKYGDRRYRDRLMKDCRTSTVISASEFDTDPYLINCINGTVNLKTKEFRPHDYKDYITKSTNVEFTTAWNEDSPLYDEQLDCVKWARFIKEITQGDFDKAVYLQKALGYSLLGKANAECMFILHGKTTRNGKSTMLDAITYLLGDYATTAPVELICKSAKAKDAEAPSPVLARLKGRRFVTMAESRDSGALDESVLKQLTGGEDITARELHQSPITYKPQFTMWLSCNSLPEVNDKSLFASDRLRVIEFNRHFSQDEQNPNLKDELREKHIVKGIFNWLLEGYYLYVEDGLVMPAHMQKVVNQYRRDNDNVIQFLEEMCQKDPENSIKGNVLYTTFKNWCRNNNARQCSAKTFNKELDAHVDWIIDSYVSGGYKTFKGIRIKDTN